MPRKTNQKPPVAPIARILYSQLYKDHWARENPKWKGKEAPEPTYERVCECKGYSDDRPFSVFKHKAATDTKPFKVVFSWTSSKHKSFTFKYMGSDRTEIDSDTYHMMDILEEHASLTAAQKSMRRFATESFQKVNNAAEKHGDVVHAKWHDGETDKEHKLRIGDLIEYTGCAGILFQVLGEVRKSDAWYTVLGPVLSFLVNNGTDNKTRELREYDVYGSVKPVDLVKLGVFYTKLGLAMQDEAKRRSS